MQTSDTVEVQVAIAESVYERRPFSPGGAQECSPGREPWVQPYPRAHALGYYLSPLRGFLVRDLNPIDGL